MSNIAILCSGGDDTSRKVNMAYAMFTVSKIHQSKPSPELLTQNNFHHARKYDV